MFVLSLYCVMLWLFGLFSSYSYAFDVHRMVLFCVRLCIYIMLCVHAVCCVLFGLMCLLFVSIF